MIDEVTMKRMEKRLDVLDEIVKEYFEKGEHVPDEIRSEYKELSEKYNGMVSILKKKATEDFLKAIEAEGNQY